jgi:hypothetical protein
MTTNPKTHSSLSPDGSRGEHDRWFHVGVEKAISRLKDGFATLISEDDHDLRWQEKRDALANRSKA